ncbi:MAG TPA: ankyrin repeat domain-containing protein [Bryobacteraceae bacterium]|nr:ankyrin repeat domain-containing protein [Bryobacteraceae bacterium]
MDVTDVRTAIQHGNAVRLEQLLAEDSARANQMIEWGKAGELRTHPLHYVSDMLFEGTLEKGKELALIDVLLAAGADCNHQASNGETPLIGAASLGAEEVGLRLLDSGARPDSTGRVGETALHWAAFLSLRRLVTRLLEKGAELDVKDVRYNASPLGWAIHGRFHPPPGSQGNHQEIVALLVGAGAKVEPQWLSDEQVRADSGMLAALGAHGSDTPGFEIPVPQPRKL